MSRKTAEIFVNIFHVESVKTLESPPGIKLRLQLQEFLEGLCLLAGRGQTDREEAFGCDPG